MALVLLHINDFCVPMAFHREQIMSLFHMKLKFCGWTKGAIQYNVLCVSLPIGKGQM